MILAGLFIEYIANNFFLDILGQRLHFYSSVCVCVRKNPTEISCAKIKRKIPHPNG